MLQLLVVATHRLIDLAHAQQLQLLLFHHDISVHLQIDFVREKMQACICKYLAGHFTRVDEVVDVVALDVIQSILHVDEGGKVEKDYRNITSLLT